MFKKLSIIALFVCLLSISSCFVKEEKKTNYIGKVSYDFFDTVSYIYNYGDDSEEEFYNVADDVFDILRNYHQLFDIYNEYEGINNICTINKNPTKAIQVDKKIIDFLDYCLKMYEITDGKTNVMLGPVLKIWHEYREEGKNLPDIEELKQASKYCDIGLLDIDKKNNTVTLLDENASLDVGAIAKGYATEKAAEYLTDCNKGGYALNIGGNIRVVGKKANGKEYTTAITNPNNKEEYALTIILNKNACVTSGNYERFYVVDGKKYHHIIDEDTLYPSEYFASVSIICDDSGLADALSTALFCMSYEDGLALLNKLDDVDAIWISKNGDIKYTDNIQLVKK